MDQEKRNPRNRGSHENPDDRILLLEKSRRGILNVIFGRTMLIVLMLGLQIMLLVGLFSRLQSLLPYYYGLMLVLYGALILHLVNKPSNPSIKITWILLIVLMPAMGVALYLFVEMDVGHRMVNRRLVELSRETLALMPRRRPVPKALLESRPDVEGLSHYAWNHGGYPLYQQTAVEYLSSGEASMEAMLPTSEPRLR